MIYIHPKAEPFYLRGSQEVALLFLHGFTASPAEVLPVARIIHNISGHTVSGPLLPGHGSHPRFLNRLLWQDWFQAVEEEIAFLQSRYNKVFVAGLSMGGLLALHAASCCQGLSGVISINAPIFLYSSCSAYLSRFTAYFLPYSRKKNLEELRELAGQGRFAYDVIPVKAYRQLLKLKARVIRDLPGLTIPALVVQSVRDRTVWPGSGPFLAGSIKGARLLELPESGHIATMGPEVELIAQEIASFMAKSDCASTGI